jgi:WD40 repeat protein
LLLLAFLDFGVGRAQEKPLTEIPDEDAPILELKPLHHLKVKESPASFCFSSDGTIFASGDGRNLRVWDSRTSKELLCLATEVWVEHVGLSPSGREAAYAGIEDSQIHVVDVASGKLTRVLPKQKVPSHSIDNFQFTADGKCIVFSYREAGLRLWRLESGEVDDHFKEHVDAFYGMALSRDGKLLAVAPEGRSVHLFDMVSGKLVRRLPEREERGTQYHGIAFSPDGQMIVISERGENPIHVWETYSGDLVCEVSWPRSLEPKKDPRDPDRERSRGIRDAIFSTDGRTFHASGDDGFDRVWETATGKLRYRVHEKIQGFMATASSAPLWASADTYREATEVVLYHTHTSVPTPRLSTPPDLEKLWAGLASDNAATAYEKMRILISLPEETVPFLAKRLSPVERVSDTEIQNLLDELDDEEFAVRDRARKRLHEIADIGKPALTKALKGKPSVEAARIMTGLIEGMSFPARGERIRVIRAVEVLETLATSEARKLLKSWSGGEPTALLTREAKAALERLERE